MLRRLVSSIAIVVMLVALFGASRSQADSDKEDPFTGLFQLNWNEMVLNYGFLGSSSVLGHFSHKVNLTLDYADGKTAQHTSAPSGELVAGFPGTAGPRWTVPVKKVTLDLDGQQFFSSDWHWQGCRYGPQIVGVYRAEFPDEPIIRVTNPTDDTIVYFSGNYTMQVSKGTTEMWTSPSGNLEFYNGDGELCSRVWWMTVE